MTDITELILTREHEDNQRLITALGDIPVPVRDYPCIATRIIPYDGSAIDGLASPADFDIIAFTSRRGVTGLAGEADRIRRSAADLAAVGTRTAEMIRTIFGKPPRFLPGIQTGEALGQLLVRELATRRNPPTLLHPRGTAYNPRFHDILRRGGIRVSSLVVYQTRTLAPDPVNPDGTPLVLFASPSAVRGFFRTNDPRRRSMVCLAIGPVTRQALHDLNIISPVMPPSSREDDVVNTIRAVIGS